MRKSRSFQEEPVALAKWLPLAVFALALLVQFPAWLQVRQDPFHASPVSDALSYDEWGLRIAQQGLAAEQVFHQAPLYPVLLSWVYRAVEGPARFDAAGLVQIVLIALACALLVPIGRLFLGSEAAGAAGALLALAHGPIAFHALKLLPVSLAIATQALALAALGLARSRASRSIAAAAGFTFGLAALARSEVLLFAPIGLLALVWPSEEPPRRARAALAVVFVAGLAAGIAPAAVHNARRGDLVLVASSGGENLFIGNQRGSQGDFTPIHPQAGDLFSERLLAGMLAEQAAGRGLLPSEVSRYWRGRAVREILADPIGWLRLETKKLGRILHPGDPNDMYSFPLERSLYLSSLYLLPLPAWALLGTGAIGMALSFLRSPRRTWPLAAFAGAHVLVLLLFFVNTRLRLPLLFILSPFGGFAVVEGVRRWRDPSRRTAVAVMAVLLGAGILASLALTRPTPRDRVRLASVLSTQNRLDEALRALEPVVSDTSGYPLALDEAGWVLQKKGDFSAAKRRYRQALGAGLAGGAATQTRTRLAIVLEKLGEVREAEVEHDAAVATPDAHAGTYYERGMFRLRQGNRAPAVADLEKAVRLDPGWEPPRLALSEIRRR